MKGTGISQLATFLSLHRSGATLNRDVIFVATADEEAGGLYGAGWLVENHPEIFRGVGLLINEGDSGTDRDGERIFSVEVTQKVPVWLKLTAVDTPGHRHPGRGNIWARLKGGDEPALILLQHTDVVPADPKFWTTDPLSGDIRDGYL